MTITIDPDDLGATRTSLGLGSAATKNTGTGNGDVPVLDSTGLPALNASQLTALNAANLTGTVPAGSLSGATYPTNVPNVAPGSDGNVLTAASGAWTSSAPAAGGAWSVRTSGSFSNTAALEVTNLTKTTSIWITNARLSSDAGHLFRVRLSSDNGSSFIATTTYSQRNGTQLLTGQNEFYCGLGSWGAEADEGVSGYFTIFDPNDSALQTTCSWKHTGCQTDGTIVDNVGGGMQLDALDIDAISFGTSATNITSGKFVVLELN